MNNSFVVRKILGSLRSLALFVSIILLFFLIGIGMVFVVLDRNQPTATLPAAPNLPATGDSGASLGVQSQTLQVNAQLQVQGRFNLAPTSLPEDATAGTLVFDQATSTLQYFNGEVFVPLTSQQSIAVPETGVTSLQGQTGAITLTPGAGININGTTISSSGLLGVNGVPGDINVATANGVATISLPQSIAPTATPSFSGLTLANALPVSSGGTGGVSFAANGVLIGNGSGAFGTVTPVAPGQCLVSTAGAPVFGACAGGGVGVSTLNTLSGNLTLANSSGIGSTITIDDASTSQKGIARFNPTNFSAFGGVINTVQNINTAATPTFAGLTLSAPLSVASGGLGLSSLTANAVLVGNGSGAPQQVTAGAAGQCLVSTAGAPIFAACPGSGGVASINGQTGAVTINNASGSGGSITINDASTSQKGIAQFNSANFTVALGTVNTIQNISSTASPTFAGLTLTGALNVASGGTGASTLTAGGILFGNGTGAVTASSVLANGQLLIGDGSGAPTAATLTAGTNISIVNGPGSITINSIVTGGVGGIGDITGNGTANRLAMFDAAKNIVNSDLLQGTGTLTLDSGANFVIAGGDLSVTGGASFTGRVSGADAVNSDEFVTLSQLNGSIGGLGGVTSLNMLDGVLSLAATTGHLSVADNGSDTITLSLPGTGVAANAYGSASQVATFTVDAQGRLTAAATIDIAINADQVVSGTLDDDRLSVNIARYDAVVAGFSGRVSGLSAVNSNEFVTLSQLNGAIGGVPGGDILQGGNSFGANMSLGTIDEFGLSLKTHNVSRISISSTGVITLHGLNCSVNANGGKLTTDASGNIICANDVGGSGGSSVVSLNSLAGALSIQGSASQITVTDNGTDTITLALDSSVTVQGNSFNGASQLVQLNASSQLPVVSGVNVTNLNASNISSGTLGDSYLSTNVALYNAATANFTGALQQNGDDVCTTAGNCAGINGMGDITGNGTANRLAMFDAAKNIVNSDLLQGTGTLTLDSGTNFVIAGGDLSVTGGASFTGRVSGADAVNSDEFVTLSQLNGAVGGVDIGVSSLNSLEGNLSLQGASSQITVTDNGTDTITLSLDSSVTTQGNTFNGASQLVQLSASSQLPAVSGVLLTDLNASNITSGTLSVARGGTGASTAQAAINSLSGLTTQGDLLYHNGTNATRLPRGTNGQCLMSTATSIQWAACPSDGVGISSLGGQTGASQTFGNDTNITITSSANVHTLGWTGTLSVARGGTGASTEAGARTSLGATTVGANFFTLTNPSAVSFARINADNTISALNAADFRSAIGAGTGDILQNGNSFGSAVTIGSNDSYALNLETDNTTRLSIDASGNSSFNGGTLYIDAANSRVGVNTTSFISGADFQVGNNSGDVHMYLYPGATNASYLNFDDSGANNIVFDRNTGELVVRANGGEAQVDYRGLSVNRDLRVDTDTLYVDSTNNFVNIGSTSNLSARLAVVGSSDQTQLLVRASSTQTSPLILAQNSDGSELFRLHAQSASLFLGYQAGWNTIGDFNTAVGYHSLRANVLGEQNSALGDAALMNATGHGNSGLGYASLASSSGSYNTAVGVNALRLVENGWENAVLGAGAAYGAGGSSSQGGVYLGAYAGNRITDADYNTLIGYRAGYNVTSGDNNILLGYQAGDNLTTGSSNIIIGNNIDASSESTSNQLRIGSGSNVTLQADLNTMAAAFNGSLTVAGNFTVDTNTLFVDAMNNRVGIGTVSPGSALQVAGTVTATLFSGSGASLTSLNADNISTGTLPVARGGSGAGSFTQYGLLFGNGAGTFGVTSVGGSGDCLVGNTGNAPTWSDCSIAGTGASPGGMAGGDLSGTYPNPVVARINGAQLGSTTATAANILIGDGTQWVTRALSGDATISSTGVVTIQAGSVTDSSLRPSSALSVIGRSANSAGAPSDILASANGHVLRRMGDALGFGLIDDSSLTTGTFSNITGTGVLSAGSITSSFGAINIGTSNVTAARFVGSTTGGTAASPTFAWTGANSNTGMYSPAQDEIAFSSDGDQKLRVYAGLSQGIQINASAHHIRFYDTDNSSNLWSLTTVNESDFGIYRSNSQLIRVSSTGALTIGGGLGPVLTNYLDQYMGVNKGILANGQIGTSHTGTYVGGSACWQDVSGFGLQQTMLGRCASTLDKKRNVRDLSMGLETLRLLQPREFVWKDTGLHDFGFIADEAVVINPLFGEYDASGKLVSFKYRELTSLLTKAVQEIDTQVQQQDLRLGNVEQQLNSGVFGDLTVSGHATISSLSVSGNVSIGGTLTVAGRAEVRGIKVNGKIVSGGNTPVANASNGSVVLSGNDTAGSITFTAGSTPQAGQQVSIVFSSPYEASPRVTMTPTGSNAASVDYYVERTAAGFRIYFVNQPSANTQYTFDYHAIQ